MSEPGEVFSVPSMQVQDQWKPSQSLICLEGVVPHRLASGADHDVAGEDSSDAYGAEGHHDDADNAHGEDKEVAGSLNRQDPSGI